MEKFNKYINDDTDHPPKIHPHYYESYEQFPTTYNCENPYIKSAYDEEKIE